jgi:hypothetical protein
MRVRDRLLLCAMAATLVAVVVVHGLTAVDTDALIAAPALLLLVLLASGAYVGSDRLEKLVRHVPRVWRRPRARSAARRRPDIRPCARGGLLIAVSLARRGPPPSVAAAR